MTPHKDLPALTPEEKLKFEKDLLKAKLTAEFGMLDSSASDIDSELENEWLKHIYDFEKAYSKRETITIYDFIGKPDFRAIDKLSKEEITSELERLYEIMYKNNIVLEVLCDYENESEVIYKFVTEEFFPLETDNVKVDGMNHMYCYEEFHPNHVYDLNRYSDEFIETVFERDFNREFDGHYLYENVEFQKNVVAKEAFIDNVIAFQIARKTLEIIKREIRITVFDIDKGSAEVKGEISYSVDSEIRSGEFKLRFKLDDLGYWNINGVEFPEFG